MLGWHVDAGHQLLKLFRCREIWVEDQDEDAARWIEFGRLFREHEIDTVDEFGVGTPTTPRIRCIWHAASILPKHCRMTVIIVCYCHLQKDLLATRAVDKVRGICSASMIRVGRPIPLVVPVHKRVTDS